MSYLHFQIPGRSAPYQAQLAHGQDPGASSAPSTSAVLLEDAQQHPPPPPIPQQQPQQPQPQLQSARKRRRNSATGPSPAEGTGVTRPRRAAARRTRKGTSTGGGSSPPPIAGPSNLTRTDTTTDGVGPRNTPPLPVGGGAPSPPTHAHFHAQQPAFQVHLPPSSLYHFHSQSRAPYGSGDSDEGYTLSFADLPTFERWRAHEEETRVVEFIKGDTHGSKAVPPRFKDHVKLVCARHCKSGRRKYVRKCPERTRKVPSRKLEGNGCPASISYKTYYGTPVVRAMYVSEHSHPTGPANLPFTRRGRKLAEQERREKQQSGFHRANAVLNGSAAVKDDESEAAEGGPPGVEEAKYENAPGVRSTEGPKRESPPAMARLEPPPPPQPPEDAGANAGAYTHLQRHPQPAFAQGSSQQSSSSSHADADTAQRQDPSVSASSSAAYSYSPAAAAAPAAVHHQHEQGGHYQLIGSALPYSHSAPQPQQRSSAAPSASAEVAQAAQPMPGGDMAAVVLPLPPSHHRHPGPGPGEYPGPPPPPPPQRHQQHHQHVSSSSNKQRQQHTPLLTPTTPSPRYRHMAAPANTNTMPPAAAAAVSYLPSPSYSQSHYSPAFERAVQPGAQAHARAPQVFSPSPMSPHTPVVDTRLSAPISDNNAQYYTQGYYPAAPAPNPNPDSDQDPQWDRMDVLFQTVRHYARTFAFSAACVADLETALVRLYAEAHSAHTVYSSSSGAGVVGVGQGQEHYGYAAHVGGGGAAAADAQARTVSYQGQADMSSGYMPMGMPSGAVVPHSTF